MLILSGYTQEYYLTRLDLDDHPEDILHFNFGTQSLTRLALEAVISLVQETEQFHSLEILPLKLRDAVVHRISYDYSTPGKRFPEDSEYSRNRIHAGV